MSAAIGYSLVARGAGGMWPMPPLLLPIRHRNCAHCGVRPFSTAGRLLYLLDLYWVRVKLHDRAASNF
jgi:hypothetical protein